MEVESMLNESVIKVLKNNMWDLAICTNNQVEKGIFVAFYTGFIDKVGYWTKKYFYYWYRFCRC